jgi:hypothetical protein
MRDRPHSHPCQRCGLEIACDGPLEENYDGWPEVICVDFDMHSHEDFLCEACAELIDHCDDGDDLVGY